ncbi:MAG: GSU2403 family nucleotidyltransferase fold protein [Desulfobaccales bacterium]
MAAGYVLTEFSPGQRQTYRTAVEIYRAFLQALAQSRSHKGGMHWKRIRGRQYLYRYRDRLGHGESLGRREETTERLFAHFTQERLEAAARVQAARLRLQEQARFCRAALINRVPKATAKILRALEQHDTGQNLLVIGTAALYAYAGGAGVFLEPPGLLAAAQRGLTLAAAGEISWEELLQVARRTDRSFAPLPGMGCRAANRDGFQVALLKSGRQRPGKQKTLTVPGAREPLPPEAGNLQFLTASSKFSQVVIGKDGGPATMVVPDPRAFALNKLWLSQQEDREESRRRDDRSQALAVAALVLRHLPQYDFLATDLDMFPQDLAPDAGQ